MKGSKRVVLLMLAVVLSLGCGTGQLAQPVNDANSGAGNNSAANNGAGNGAGNSARPAVDQPKTYGFTVVAKYPHDPMAFTQGLQYYNGFLYEGTGLAGRSSIRKVDMKTGQVLQKSDLSQRYFGEGITILNNKLYELTWTTKVGFVYDLDTFKPAGEFHYDWEGWGMTNDGHDLIISDGSNKIRFVDPSSFNVVKTIEVFKQGRPLDELNELEYINGEIYSNIWHSDLIARISPADGKLTGLIDLHGLAAGVPLGSEDVLNGIAYDPKSGCLLVTGKRWPWLYQIRLK